MHACPESGASSVVRIRTRVVLPAPFGPSSAKTRPGSALRTTPASATVVPKDFRTPSTSIIEPPPLNRRPAIGDPLTISAVGFSMDKKLKYVDRKVKRFLVDSRA